MSREDSHSGVWNKIRFGPFYKLATVLEGSGVACLGVSVLTVGNFLGFNVL